MHQHKQRCERDARKKNRERCLATLQTPRDQYGRPRALARHTLNYYSDCIWYPKQTPRDQYGRPRALARHTLNYYSDCIWYPNIHIGIATLVPFVIRTKVRTGSG
ncbi:hypothetical protein QE152_g34079 [Popillia japonica]|uniref:Uncharacterized protein n=1 Tax=Popillia japonica TaxID=7064 RepID=A0AAW1IUP0_POPJA